MSKYILYYGIVLALLLLSGCATNPEVQLVELSKNTVVYDEIIRINNCGGKGDSEQTASREFATTVEFGAGVSAGYQSIVQGNLSTKYSEYRNTSKSQRLVAPPGTNMEFVLRWSDEVRAGNVQISGKSGTYEVRVPVSVEQISSRDLECDASGSIQPTPPGTLAQSTGVPDWSTTAMPPTAVPTSPLLTKGDLVYEDSFETPFGWNVEEGMEIENGNLIVRPGYDAVPKDPASYADFIFESRFYVPISGSMAFYLRHQRPPCLNRNCSIQIALYYNNGYQELAARRFLGDEPSQQFDLKKARITFLNLPGWNKIIVQAKGSVYTVYVNDRFIFDFTDDTYTSGVFVIDNAPDSKSEIKVDYIRIFQIP